MILTKHFVFVHVPKTGGQFVRRTLRKHCPADWEPRELAPHTSAAEVPASHAAMPKFGFVRNPFDWYASWDTYHRQQHALGTVARGHYFRLASRDGALSFREMLPRLLDLEGSNDKGFYTRYLECFLGPDLNLVDVLQTESLRRDLIDWFRHLPLAVPDTMVRSIRNSSKVNRSRRTHYADYYDDACRELVSTRDAGIIERFQYGFEGQPV